MRRLARLILTLVSVLSLGPGLPTTAPVYADHSSSGAIIDALMDPLINECSSSLTQNELAALVLSIPWHEVTGGDTDLTPSPMTLSRHDTDPQLHYDFDQTGATKRAFWHPGIGPWQFDDGGIGAWAGRERFDSGVTGHYVARNISGRYCDGETAFEEIFVPWHACDNGECEATFLAIYSSGTDSLTHLTEDSQVGLLGGSVERTCIFPQIDDEFTCLYVDPANAQGFDDWATTPSPDASTSNDSPLAYPFYVFTQIIGTDAYEWRVWITEDTPDPIFDTSVAARRPLGSNSRSSLEWFSTVGLCDTSEQRGECLPGC